MNCPSCNTEIQDDLIIKAAASINGSRGRGDSKRRDPKKMSECGKKGGWPKGRPRGKRVKSFEDLLKTIGIDKMTFLSDMVRPDGEPDPGEEE